MGINKILIVDDNTTMLTNLNQIISDYGIVPEVADNGQIAIDKALSLQPDLIFLDIVMPEMDGYETCRKLKNNAQTKNIPIVFVSSKDQKADKLWAEMQGSNGFITKPYASEDIINAIKEFS